LGYSAEALDDMMTVQMMAFRLVHNIAHVNPWDMEMAGESEIQSERVRDRERFK